MKITNPVLRGFYPDPSVCYAQGKYYMVCSSFEYFPGVPLFESEDLVHWHQIGHCLTRPSQVDLKQINSSGGVFAPTIRYHEGRFYMVTTNDTYQKNFFVYTDDIYGEWSDPVFVDQDGIDPSLFFEDGKTYFMSNGSDPADNCGCIYQCEINPVTGEKLTESKPIWKGSGGRYLESPHLFHIGDWYYLTAAEGGTEYGHMITYSRGKTPYGPFENYPLNPVVTNRNLGGHQSTIQGIGHGDLVQTPQGETFILCLGFRQEGMWMPFHHLGREVFLVPVQWHEDGWFTAGVNGTVQETMELAVDTDQDVIPGQYDVSFEKMPADHPRWCHLREYHPQEYTFDGDCVRLTGNRFTLCDVDCPTFLGVRQAEFDTDLEVVVSGQVPEVGVTFYLSEDHHYDLAVTCEQGVRSVILRLVTGDAVMIREKIEVQEEKIRLHVVSTAEEYAFYARIDGREVFLGKARSKYLSSEVAGGFTGTVLGLYAVNPQEDKSLYGCFEGLRFTQTAK